MTNDPHSADETPSPLDPQNLDGHTIESLSDYLDRGREPRDPSIESSPAAQHALAALSRLRIVAPRVLISDGEAKQFAPQNDHWIKRILDQIGVQAHAGRDIPISHDVEGADLSISEGAIRAIAREVGDGFEGLVVERCRLDGDVETPGAPVALSVEVSTFSDLDHGVIDEFRAEVEDAVVKHVALHLTGVTVTVRDTDLSEEDGRAR